MKISSDSKLNKELQNQVQEMREVILNQVNSIAGSNLFTFEKEEDSPKVLITNRENGKSTTVGLFAYREVKRVSDELF